MNASDSVLFKSDGVSTGGRPSPRGPPGDDVMSQLMSRDRSTCTSRTVLTLYTPQDVDWLSDTFCILRAQIEVFAASPDDVNERGRKGGCASIPITVGRVGLRCIHCARLPRKSRVKGSVSYPKSMRLVNQAVRNYLRYHFHACQEIPQSTKERYEKAHALKDNSKKESAKYWIQCCERMGMVDVRAESNEEEGGSRDSRPSRAAEASTGIRFRPDTGTGVNSSNGGDRLCGGEKGGNGATLPNASTCSTAQSISDGAFIAGLVASGDGAAAVGNFQDGGISDVGINGANLGNEPLAPPSVWTTDAASKHGSDLMESLEAEAEHEIEAPSGVSAVDDNSIVSDDLEWLMAALDCEKPSAVAAATEPGMRVEEDDRDSADSSRLLDAIRTAHELSKKIREGHDKGIAHYKTSISADRRLLSSEEICNDLGCLGSSLYKVFDPSDSMRASTDEVEEDTTDRQESSISEVMQTKKKERRAEQRAYVPLRDLGLPVSLCILVSSLMDAVDSDAYDRYQTADEVEEDLRLMTINPKRYLFDSNADQRTGQLELHTCRLYGREQDISMLMSVFDRVIGLDHPSEMILISGHSGTGKSILVEQLRLPLYEKNGHFLSVKFDELGQVHPMSAIFSAFNEFCSELLERDVGSLEQVRSAINLALGPNAGILMDLIPNLRLVIGETTSVASSRVSGREGWNQIIYYFRLFVRTIASPSRPAVVLLDDLQWADKTSLELMTMLASDREARSLVLIGCYRGIEVGLDHPLQEEIVNIMVAGVAFTTVKLENINRQSVNTLVSETLHLSPRVTQSLANVVYAKTSGNPLFVVQFLRSLWGEHLLRYSARSRRWEWDVETIQAKDIADNVVDLMTHKIQKLDPDVQWLLKVAACLGSRSEASTLMLLSSSGDEDDGSGIIPFFDLAANEGLMSRMGSSYKFSHDLIKQAAYSLIPVLERDAWHLRVGRLLWEKASEAELNSIIFLVVDLLMRGSGLISDRAEKVELARLCFMAGEKAMSSSAFLQASTCLLQGSTLLDESDWEEHYELSLRLFSCCAEAQYVTGNYDGCAITVSPIFTHGRCLQDKLRAYYTLLYSLGAQGKQVDAIKHGIDMLTQLGVSFPHDPTQADVVVDFGIARARFEVAMLDDIGQMNAVDDAKQIAVMKILYISSRYAYQVNQPLMALMVFRMVQISHGHGICPETPYAFALFGVILCTFGELEQAFLCGKLALNLLERCNAKESTARVYIVVYGLINVYSAPVQSNLPFLRHGYEIGMSMGDIEGALTSAVAYVMYATQSGSQLGPLAEEMRACIQQLKEYKHNMLWVALPYYQAILNLMGNTQDPTDLSGDAMNQDEMLNFALEKQLLNVADKVHLMRLWLAYLFRRHDVAAEVIKYRRVMSEARPTRPESLAFETFYAGLTAVVMAHKNEGGEWRSIASEAVEKMKTWADNSSWNFQHKLDLMNAETAYYLNGDVDAATKAYDDAIRNAGEHHFVREQALACEMAGVFHSKTSNAVVAAEYFKRAKLHYLKWGAARKAADIDLQRLGNIK